MGSGHFQAKGVVILHLDDKNLPPVRTTSFCIISERYFENRYSTLLAKYVGGPDDGRIFR
jgi:hypothetical protein